MDFCDNYTQATFIFSTKMILTTCLALSNQYHSNIKSDVLPTNGETADFSDSNGSGHWYNELGVFTTIERTKHGIVRAT